MRTYPMQVSWSRDCDASVRLTAAPFLYVKNIVARVLNVLRILSKQPPIEVMMQKPANSMMRPILIVYFPKVLS